MQLSRLSVLVFLALTLPASSINLQAEQSTALSIMGSETGLALPRFVTFALDKGRMRAKPSTNHRVLHVYVRQGLPLKVLEEEGSWRRVQDHDGVEGWMNRSLLSNDRGFRVMAPLARMYQKADLTSGVKAELQAGVVGALTRCRDDGWCRAVLPEVSGWIQAGDVWGVLPGEEF